MNNVTANFSKTQHYNPQRIYHSQRKTFAESAVEMTNTTASAATRRDGLTHPSPFHIP